jgi:anti-sigma factor RsiW
MNDNLKLESELKLQAWLDGELSAPEAQRISREIAGDAAAGRLVAELQAIKNALAGGETAVTVPETREFYWSKIERQIQRQAPARRQAAWLHWLSPVSGLAALACMAWLAAGPFTTPSFDDISSTGEGTEEAVTFHDQAAGITVVWLSGVEQPEPVEIPAASPPEAGDSDMDM